MADRGGGKLPGIHGLLGDSNSFIFLQFSVTNLQNNRLAVSTPTLGVGASPRARKILDPPLDMEICFCATVARGRDGHRQSLAF